MVLATPHCFNCACNAAQSGMNSWIVPSVCPQAVVDWALHQPPCCCHDVCVAHQINVRPVPVEPPADSPAPCLQAAKSSSSDLLHRVKQAETSQATLQHQAEALQQELQAATAGRATAEQKLLDLKVAAQKHADVKAGLQRDLSRSTAAEAATSAQLQQAQQEVASRAQEVAELQQRLTITEAGAADATAASRSAAEANERLSEQLEAANQSAEAVQRDMQQQAEAERQVTAVHLCTLWERLQWAATAAASNCRVSEWSACCMPRHASDQGASATGCPAGSAAAAGCSRSTCISRRGTRKRRCC